MLSVLVPALHWWILVDCSEALLGFYFGANTGLGPWDGEFAHVPAWVKWDGAITFI